MVQTKTKEGSSNSKDNRKIPNGSLANLTTDIHRVIKELGRRPTVDDYITYGKYYINAVYRAFNQDWEGVLATLRYKAAKGACTRQDVVEELERVSKKLSKLPTIEEYSQLSKIDVSTVMQVTKSNSWIEILSSVFNITKEKVEEVIDQNHPIYQEQLTKLKTIAEKLRRIPTIEEAIKYGVKVDLLSKRLNKNWAGLLVEASIISSRTQISQKPLPKRVITVIEMLDDLNNLARLLGYYPNELKYDQLGSYSSSLLTYCMNVNWVGVIDLARNRERVFGSNKPVIREKVNLNKSILEFFDIPYNSRQGIDLEKYKF